MTTTTTRSHSLFSPARIAAGALTVALLGTFTLSAWAQGGPGMFGGGHGGHGGPMAMGMMHGGGPGMGMGPGMMGGGRGMERMLDGVNATAEQRTQLKAIFDKARADMLAQRESARGLREQGAKLFAQPNVDANAVETLRQQMMQQHDQASRRMAQAMVDASRVLTPEQRKTLVDRMAQRRELMERHRAEREALGGGRPAQR